MCNLYTVRKSIDEVAKHFGVSVPIQTNAGAEVFKGQTGVVVREQDGARIMQSMTWGFPRRLPTMKPGSKPLAVNNVADYASRFWKASICNPAAHCIIPLTAFAEAEGPKGAMTRTWFNLKDQPIFAWAGVWRDSAEWGPVYSGLMTDCNEAIRPVHNRMPVLLHAEEYDQWLHGSFDDAIAFKERCFPDELIEVVRTSDPWVQRRAPTAPVSEGSLL